MTMLLQQLAPGPSAVQELITNQLMAISYNLPSGPNALIRTVYTPVKLALTGGDNSNGMELPVRRGLQRCGAATWYQELVS